MNTNDGMVAWGTVGSGGSGGGSGGGTSVRDRFRDSLVKRALKRQCVPVADGEWMVVGDERLGDSYPYYTVTWDGGYHHCTCQDHAGGEFRRVCSHIVRVMLWKEEKWEEWRDGRNDAPTATDTSGSSSPSKEGPSTSPTPSSTVKTAPVEPRLDPHDGTWGSPEFPAWVGEFRPHQEDAIEDVLDAYKRGKKVVMLDAPTGSGKTLIAEAVRRKLGGAALYSCTTKTLQDQVLEDYPYATVLKGRDNYPTELAPFPDVTTADCTGMSCNWCMDRSSCSYQIAKAKALGSRFTVLNSAYLLTAFNGPRTFTGRDLVVLDECDLLEGALMGYVEVRISKGKQDRYGIAPPKKVTVAEAWREWVEGTLPIIRAALSAIPEDTEDVKQIREARWLSGTLSNLTVLKEGLDGEEVQWVYDNSQDSIVFRPVEVSEFGQGYLWQHGQRFLLMSASIISGEEMARSLGLEDDEWEVVKVPSTFPVENRPVYPVYAGRVTYKTYADVIDEVARYVSQIIEAHPGERMLVHTVSYRMANDLRKRVSGKYPMMTYTNSREREGVLAWMKSTEGAVVFAPSFDRGVDLPGELCTVTIIAKVPYPYLRDKQVSTRLHSRGGQLWYSVQTVRTLVQMTGRGVRSKDDACTTYIIDRQFNDFWRRNRQLFPDWWKQAVDWSGRARVTLGL